MCHTSNGFSFYNFSPYCGKSENKDGPVGTRVISEFTNMIPELNCNNHKLFFDNIFTKIVSLVKKNLKATGTIIETHAKYFPLKNSKRMKKEKKCGFYYHNFNKETEILV